MKCTLSQSNLTNKQLHDHSDEKKAVKLLQRSMPHAGAGAGSGAQMAGDGSVAVEDGWVGGRGGGQGRRMWSKGRQAASTADCFQRPRCRPRCAPAVSPALGPSRTASHVSPRHLR
uniref:Uncharacterized protein n=1 Tax=Oryza glumipatula TaxID=40148 RepID=A0A0E0B8M1_9ORYZ